MKTRFTTLREILNHIKHWLAEDTTQPNVYILIENPQNDPVKVLSFRSNRDPEKLMQDLTQSKEVAMIFQINADQTAILPNGEVCLDILRQINEIVR